MNDFINDVYKNAIVPLPNDTTVDSLRIEFERAGALVTETMMSAAFQRVPPPGTPIASANDAYFLANCVLQYIAFHKMLSTAAGIDALAQVVYKAVEKGGSAEEIKQTVQAMQASFVANARPFRISTAGTVRHDLHALSPEEAAHWAPFFAAIEGILRPIADLAVAAAGSEPEENPEEKPEEPA